MYIYVYIIYVSFLPFRVFILLIHVKEPGVSFDGNFHIRNPRKGYKHICIYKMFNYNMKCIIEVRKKSIVISKKYRYKKVKGYG